MPHPLQVIFRAKPLQSKPSHLLSVLLLLLVACFIVPTSFAAADPAGDVPSGTIVPEPAPGNSLDAAALPPGDAAPTPPVPAQTVQRGFFTRLGHAYLDDWTV